MPRHVDRTQVTAASVYGAACRLIVTLDRDPERADQLRASWPELAAVLDDLRALTALPDAPTL